MVEIMYLTKLQVKRRFLASIIIDVMSILFYKVIDNIGLVFNLVTMEFFHLLYARMLVFLFAIIYCSKTF